MSSTNALLPIVPYQKAATYALLESLSNVRWLRNCFTLFSGATMTLEELKKRVHVTTYTGSEVAVRVSDVETGLHVQVNYKPGYSTHKAREEAMEKLLEKINRESSSANG